MLEPNDLIKGENEEETERLRHEEAVSEDIPQSLLSYFEASKNRASVCEKLILQDLEDFPVSHHKGLINSSFELNKDLKTQNETMQTPCETNSDSVDGLMQSDVSVKISDYEAKGEKRHCEEVQKKEQRLQREADFQEELKKLKEAEKFHQFELELMKRRAQEKIEQELLLQQELFGNLKKQVEQERRRIDEQRKRRKAKEEREIKEMEEKRMREEENKKKQEEERKIMEEEEKRKRGKESKKKREEERKRVEEEATRKREEENKEKKEERKTVEEEEKRKREEENKKKEEERKRVEEEATRKREEENKEKKEEERKRVEEEEKRRGEEENKRKQAEERKIMKEEEKKKRKEENKKKEQERKRVEEEEKRKREVKKEKKRGEERKRVEVEETGKREEENEIREDERKIMKEEEKRRKEEEDKMKREDSKKIEEEEEKFVEIRFKEEGDEEKREEEQKKKKRDDNRIHEVKTNRENEFEGKMNGSLFKGEEMIRLEEEGWKDEEEAQREGLKNRNKEEDEETKKEKMKHERMKEIEEEEQKKKEWIESKRKDGTSKKDLLLFEDGEEMKKRDEVRIQSLKTKHLERKEEERKTNNQVEKEKVERKRLKEEEYGNTEEESRIKEEMKECKGHEGQMNPEGTKEDEEKEDDKWKTGTGDADVRLSVEKMRECEEEKMKNGDERLTKETEDRERKQDPNEEVMITKNELMEKKGGSNTDENWDSSRSGSSLASSLTISDIKSDQNICPMSADETTEQHSEVKPRPSSCSSPAFLPEHTEQKRLSWMKDCVSWSQLSHQNRRKQNGSVRGRRRPRGAAEPSSPPPLCPRTLLQSSGWKSLQEITSLTLEELSSCSLSTLVQCPQLRSLTLRRCGIRSLEGISQLKELCYIDLRENEISSVDCENMTSLRVLRLAHNKLTSIHGLGGAENLDVLDLSYNSITRIAGLESVKRLQKLSVNHNQLISTKGLKDVYTLLYLDCSHNHLACVECLDGSALLHTLDLRANSLSEPPSLNNQVLLRTLRLDDNNISCLQGLADCWLPLLQHLSATQNRITQLPSMADFVSLENLDLRFNCLSELQNVCENLEGCRFLQEVLLSGNPVQQESGWRSALQSAVPGLRVIDNQQSPVAAQQLTGNLDGFFMFCQAQLQQTQGLQQHLSRELRNNSSPLDALKANCWFFTMALRLAEDQRFAHEYGDTSVSDQHLATHKTPPEETLGVDCGSSEKLTDYPKSEPVVLNGDNIRDTNQSFEDSPAEETQETLDSATAGTRTESTVAQKGERNSFSPDKEPLSTYHYLDLKNRAAVVTQQRWRKNGQKCGNVNASSITDKGEDHGGDEGKLAGPSSISRSAVSPEDAATVIQAFWRGFILRRRLASALAAVTCSDDEEDDALEEVDLEEFVFDESALEKYWTLTLPEDSPRPSSASERSLTVKPIVTSHGHSQEPLQPPLVWIPKQAWMAEDEESELQRTATESTNRSQPPASASAHCGLSQQVKEIMEEWGFTDSHTALLLLKRAQKMKPAKQKQNKHSNLSVHAALLRNSNYQLGSVEARSRLARHNRYCLKVGEAKLDFHQGEQVEETRRQQEDQRLQTQAGQPDSEPFLPEISSSVLSGGRVQLVAAPSYVDAPNATGLCVDTSLIIRPFKGKPYPHRNTLDHYGKDVSSSQRDKSSLPANERISFRDSPVRLSGGWGGGKKRDRSKTFSHK